MWNCSLFLQVFWILNVLMGVQNDLGLLCGILYRIKAYH